jgi:hypothetical protein
MLTINSTNHLGDRTCEKADPPAEFQFFVYRFKELARNSSQRTVFEDDKYQDGSFETWSGSFLG